MAPGEESIARIFPGGVSVDGSSTSLEAVSSGSSDSIRANLQGLTRPHVEYRQGVEGGHNDEVTPRDDDAATHILPPELADDETGATQILPAAPRSRMPRSPAPRPAAPQPRRAQAQQPAQATRPPRRGRSLLLLVLGVLVLLPAAFCLYTRINLLDEQQLANTVVQTVNRPQVRQFIATKAADGVIAAVPALASQRSTLETASSKVVSTGVFQGALRQTTVAAEKALLESGSQATAMSIQNLGSMVKAQVTQVNPGLAAQIPDNLGAQLLKLDRSSALPAILRAVHGVQFMGLVLPPIAIALLLASVFVAGSRRAAFRRLGVALVVWGAGCFLLLAWGRSLALGAVPAGLERDAAGPVWDQVVGGLRTWVLLVGATGIVAVVGASLVRHRSSGEGL